ncbi:TBC1 domain family member 2B isoform X1 [Ixodes scapularis]|uniref:TBC1 domain family member 2B isoform X1 n=2 Tax=Ixodes scapularis TaxID=6945 RepID=UPI001C39142A|nr:TBC1 domain family member 2B isoform X1 [Ixodes scapularis]
MDSAKGDSDSATVRATVDSPAGSAESTSTEQRQPQRSSRSTDVQLCGFLNKLSSTSLVKTYKRRWFVFNEGNCKLYYYREPQDVHPLGEIDVKSASFYLDVTNWEKPGVFVIRTPQRDYHLEAKDRQAGLYWLQELQRFRREYSLRRNLNLKQSRSVSDSCSPQQVTGGLLRKEPERLKGEAGGEDPHEGFLLSLVECPTAVVGEHTAQQQQQQSPSHSFSVLSNLRHPAALFQRRQRSQSTDEIKAEASSHFYLNESEELYEDDEGSDVPSSPTKLKSPAVFTTFKKKLQHSFRTRPKLESDMFSSGPPLLRKLHECTCSKCKELEAEASNLREDLQCKEDELSASKEVIKVLRQQLDLANTERETLVELYANSSNENYSKMLHDKDRLLLELRNELYMCKLQLESTQHKRCSVEKELDELKDRSSLYQEVLKEKDKILMSLTNELYDIETEKKEEEIAGESAIKLEQTKMVEEIETLRDAVSAFHVQNKFLNKEILELNELRWNSEERERQLVIKCSNAEARHYQTQSKLLFLLKELNAPQEGDSNVQGIVSQLLEEAMHDPTLPKEIHDSFLGSDEVYDTYGFNRKWGKECDMVVSKAENLKRKSENISLKMQDSSLISWRVKWENYLVNCPIGKPLQKNPELKALVRTGIPQEFRSRVWRGCVEFHAGQERAEKGPGYYEDLLTTPTITSAFDPAVKQIELDLLRTLPNNRHYETPDAPGINPLRRVLLAYSRRNLIVGYCQGLNRLAAIALLFMSEEDAFWCLVTVVEYIMPRDYYSRTLEASQVDQRVLKDLMIEKLPRLYAHLESNKVDLSLFTFNWFLTVFVDTIPAETYLYIWDVFLYEGNKVLFRFALAIFKICETEILNQEDYMAINRYLRTMPEKMTNTRQLGQVAFNELNPFPMRVINAKRAAHMQAVKEQLRKLDEIRNSLPERSTTPSNQPSSPDDPSI